MKKNLNCKPFQYFLDEVAPDILERHPINDPGVFASGVIQSEFNTSFCVSAASVEHGKPLVLAKCDQNLTNPRLSQDFHFMWHRQIKRKTHSADCVKSRTFGVSICGYHFSDELWFYNLVSWLSFILLNRILCCAFLKTTHQIVNPPTNVCLTAIIPTNSLVTTQCDHENLNQKWRWGYTNITALENWKTFGVKIPETPSPNPK